MKPLGLVITRVATLLFALTMLTGYVCFRQEIGPFAKADPPSAFPITPTSPTMFDTSKSGRVVVSPSTLPSDAHAIFSGSKAGILITQEGRKEVPLTPEGIDAMIEEAVAAASDPQPEAKPLLIPGTKSINMPVFNVRRSPFSSDIESGEDPFAPEIKLEIELPEPPNSSPPQNLPSESLEKPSSNSE